jgi:hypothetical protein
MPVRTPLEPGRRAAPLGVLGAVTVAFAGPVLGVTFSWFVGRHLPAADPLSRLVVGTTAYGVGLVVVGVAFLALAGRLDDLGPPRLDARRARLVVVGVAFLVGTWLVAVVGLDRLGVPFAGNATTSLAERGRRLSLLVFAVLSPLVIAPTEEFLFRGTVQATLYDVTSRPMAIAVASVPFALIHVPTFHVDTTHPTAVAVSLLAVFGLSLVFGWLHARTDDLLVPTAVHGGYNAVVYCLLFLGLF